MKPSLDYPRYKPRRVRPFGMGAFFDYAMEMSRLYGGNLEFRASRLGWRKKSPGQSPPEKIGL
jgi:hypothetical protein